MGTRKGLQELRLFGWESKWQVTAVFAESLTGEFLSLQFIYKSTTYRCLGMGTVNDQKVQVLVYTYATRLWFLLTRVSRGDYCIPARSVCFHESSRHFIHLCSWLRNQLRNAWYDLSLHLLSCQTFCGVSAQWLHTTAEWQLLLSGSHWTHHCYSSCWALCCTAVPAAVSSLCDVSPSATWLSPVMQHPLSVLRWQLCRPQYLCQLLSASLSQSLRQRLPALGPFRSRPLPSSDEGEIKNPNAATKNIVALSGNACKHCNRWGVHIFSSTVVLCM